MLSGVLAALPGLFSTAHMGLANRYLGTDFEMTVIACLPGGGGIAGGKGSVLGAVVIPRKQRRSWRAIPGLKSAAASHPRP